MNSKQMGPIRGQKFFTYKFGHQGLRILCECLKMNVRIKPLWGTNLTDREQLKKLTNANHKQNLQRLDLRDYS